VALIGVTGGDDAWPPVTTPQEGPAVKNYDVVINGVETTLQLSDADAQARGLTPAADEVPTKVAAAPANKSRRASTKRAEAAAAAFHKGD